jgi:hypothetical protein
MPVAVIIPSFNPGPVKIIVPNEEVGTLFLAFLKERGIEAHPASKQEVMTTFNSAAGKLLKDALPLLFTAEVTGGEKEMRSCPGCNSVFGVDEAHSCPGYSFGARPLDS